MQFIPTIHPKRAAIFAVSTISLAVLSACGGGSSSGGTTPPNTGADLYRGVNCTASSNGTSDGFVLGVCDVVATNTGLETSKSAVHNVNAVVGSSKATPTVADVIAGKSLTITLPTSVGPLNGTGLAYGTNTDPCTYYGLFGNLRGLTMTRFVTGSTTPLLDVTSLASAIPGINANVCSNTAAEPNVPPAVALTGMDFGVYRYYVGADVGVSDASFNGGWYSRLTATSALPAAGAVFATSTARLGGYYSTPQRFFAVSSTPSSITWTASTSEVQINIGTWTYFNNIASSTSPGPGTQTYAALAPKLSNIVLKGAYDSVTKKIVGTVTAGVGASVGIDFGSFEGEFNATGTEFAGRFTAKVSGADARIAGAVAFKQ